MLVRKPKFYFDVILLRENGLFLVVFFYGQFEAAISVL